MSETASAALLEYRLGQVEETLKDHKHALDQNTAASHATELALGRVSDALVQFNAHAQTVRELTAKSETHEQQVKKLTATVDTLTQKEAANAQFLVSIRRYGGVILAVLGILHPALYQRIVNALSQVTVPQVPPLVVPAPTPLPHPPPTVP